MLVRPSDVSGPRTAFLVARSGGVAVGCCAVRPRPEWSAEIGEVKRVYVEPAARRRGIARRLLQTLEAEARGLGYAVLRLETGTLQPEAMALYAGLGYGRIACYGEHADDPLSVCYEKRLA